jgi:phosphomannomutase
MADKITFGTDGWRGVIAHDFTFANVRRVAGAIAGYVRAEGEPDKGVVIGYDTRFLSSDFARAAAEVIAAADITVFLADQPTPTPALSYAVQTRQAAGGVMITASHNPYRWNGVKFKAPYGGSAAPAIMQAIEQRLPRSGGVRTRKHGTAPIQTVDLVAPYLERLEKMVHLDRIRDSGRRFVIDPMHGAGCRCIARLFEAAGISCHEIHGEQNPLFPGINPEPIEPHVAALRAAVLEGGFDAGLATDGDADRVGAVDRTGTFIDSHKIFSILLKHLAEDLSLRGEVVKTFSTTRMIDKLALKHHLPLHVTPIGFKYICELMLAHNVLIGGEESGGIGIKGHLPERDGILNSLLLAEVIADKGKTLGELVEELNQEFGPHHYGRVDLEIERGAINRLLEQVRDQNYRQVAGLAITGRDELDGCKMLFGDSAWLLVRASGTENVIRFYAEAPSERQVKMLLDEMVSLARQPK